MGGEEERSALSSDHLSIRSRGEGEDVEGGRGDKDGGGEGAWEGGEDRGGETNRR